MQSVADKRELAGTWGLLWSESLAELTPFYQHHVLFNKYRDDDDLVFNWCRIKMLESVIHLGS